MNALKCIKTPAVSAVRSLISSRSISSSAIIANNIRDDLKQSANRATTWSENQIEKKNAFKGPRFENTDIQAQEVPAREETKDRHTETGDQHRIRPASHRTEISEEYGIKGKPETKKGYPPQPKAAVELIAEEPIRMVEGRRARCDGGGGSLGHPAVWINLDRPGNHACGYCGIRFEQKPHHHHH
ncbi:hypothetical protein BGZ47_004880 [Haplosporangium gracile]|nr:hypothetical protein BGZ47_004880 [Haplosporangium gracile]